MVTKDDVCTTMDKDRLRTRWTTLNVRNWAMGAGEILVNEEECGCRTETRHKELHAQYMSWNSRIKTRC